MIDRHKLSIFFHQMIGLDDILHMNFDLRFPKSFESVSFPSYYHLKPVATKEIAEPIKHRSMHQQRKPAINLAPAPSNPLECADMSAL